METKPQTTNLRTVRKHRVEVVAAGASVRVKVYATHYRGRKYWEVRDHFGGRGQTHRKKFAVKAKALLHADRVAAAMTKGEAALLRVTATGAAEYEQALLILKPIGKSVLQLAYEERELWQLSQQMKLGESPLVADVVKQFLADKTRQELSEYHLRDLTLRLNRFAKDFQLPINRLGHVELEAWLNGLTTGEEKQKRTVAGRTWNNYRSAVAALCQFAQARKYLPADWQELEAIAPVKLRRKQKKIWTPENMSALLSASSERLLPALVISAFAGLRSEEVQRLNWADVKLEKRQIILREEITKTKRIRAVPILDNLAEWLKPWSEATGKVCDYANLSVGKCNLARRVGLKWSRNVLRNSFISYRLAAIQDLAQVAVEAGNSPGVINSNYLELTTPAEAAKWFAIQPRSVEQNVLPLKFR